MYTFINHISKRFPKKVLVLADRQYRYADGNVELGLGSCCYKSRNASIPQKLEEMNYPLLDNFSCKEQSLVYNTSNFLLQTLGEYISVITHQVYG